MKTSNNWLNSGGSELLEKQQLRASAKISSVVELFRHEIHEQHELQVSAVLRAVHLRFN